MKISKRLSNCCCYLYFLEIISGNNCQQCYVIVLLYSLNHFCKMLSYSKVTEALRRQVVQIKVDRLSPSAIGRDVGRSKRVIMKLHNDSIHSSEKTERSRKPSPRENRTIQRLSTEGLFDTAAGISRQIGANLGNRSVSSYSVSTSKSGWTESTPPSHRYRLVSIV